MSSDLSFLWLEVTGECQLSCTHCYADSGPGRGHGAMRTDDWHRVIDEATQLSVRMVQFIGGEPTLHPQFADLVRHALDNGVVVEVFSNLSHVPAATWSLLERRGVQLATSYYSDRPDEHEAITRGRGSHARTRTNIAEAVRRSIPLRVGLIDVGDQQRVRQAREELADLGVTNVGVDHVRHVGRGTGSGPAVSELSQLCGACGHGKLAVSPDGEVWPCVFARSMPIGNVRRASLADILTSPATRSARTTLGTGFAVLGDQKCEPRTKCDPARSSCQPTCPPGYHTTPKRCWPYYYDDTK
jgi:radical SAM protein with 4Fe4S-binding SPASM domain